MGVVIRKMGIDVLSAAKMRIKTVFDNGTKVYVSSSGGKDSITLMSLVYDLIQEGEVDPSKLTVVFIDEEVIYPEVVRICEQWRKKFKLIGADYIWYTIEHRNNNCFNALENNENFIPWDRYEESVWARPKPSFAVSDSPYLIPRVENYQDFLARSQRDGVTMIGVRYHESLQRLQNLAKVKGGYSSNGVAYPIYDWSDGDVWKYIKDRGLDFPDTYLKMYECGLNRSQLRICNLFAIDTCRALTCMFEAYPDLWQAVLRREPNAELVRLYWDTEMFRRSTEKRKRLEGDSSDGVDYRKKVLEITRNPTKYFRNPHALNVCYQYKMLVVKEGLRISDKHWKQIYEALLAGDTKTRSFRAIRTRIMVDGCDDEGGDAQALNLRL